MQPPCSILLVDDDEIMRTLVKALLADEPWARIVGAVADGARALELLERTHVDVAIVDLLMPGMDGYELIDRLGKLEQPPAAVAFSSMFEEAARQRLPDCVAFVPKHLPQKLVPAITRVCAETPRGANPQQS